MATIEQVRAAQAAVKAVLDTIRDTGPMGCPEGPLYAALMGHGCTLSQFQSLIGALERAGKVRREGHVLHAV